MTNTANTLKNLISSLQNQNVVLERMKQLHSQNEDNNIQQQINDNTARITKLNDVLEFYVNNTETTCN